MLKLLHFPSETLAHGASVPLLLTGGGEANPHRGAAGGARWPRSQLQGPWAAGNSQTFL